jgi:hypothetical protein
MLTAGSGATRRQSTGESTMPSRNAIRQPLSLFARDSTPPRMPLIPATRPQNRISIDAAAPITTPPMALPAA